MTDDTTTTIDLQDRVDEIQARLDEIRAVLGDLKAKGDAAGEDTDPWELLEDLYDGANITQYVDRDGFGDGADPVAILEAEGQALVEAEAELENARDDLQDDIEDWGGSEFEIVKFDAGRQGQRNDLVAGDMARSRDDSPEANQSAARLRTVQVGITSMPPDCPDNPRKFSAPSFNYLHGRIENLNTYGDPEGVEDFQL